MEPSRAVASLVTYVHRCSYMLCDKLRNAGDTLFGNFGQIDQLWLVLSLKIIT